MPTTRRQFLQSLGLGAAAAAAPAWLHAAEPGKKLNVVFFLIDDLGWADVGCYGSTYYETPNIDRLAAQGMRFTDAYAACPVCSPTRASIMTGKYPARLHLTDWIAGHRRPYAKLAVPDWTMSMPLSEVTIAEAFKEAGYATGFMGKWHLGNSKQKPEEYYPEYQGFDVNIGGYFRGSPPSYFAPYRIPAMKEGPKGEYLTDRLADDALRFIDANKDKPFFLYLSHYAVHTPIQAKKELTEHYAEKKPTQQKNPKYAAMIQSVDEGVGRIMKKLDDLGLADHTAIVFMSDNGGLFGVTSNAPLRAGKGTAYEGGIREPMIIKWPGVVQPGSTCRTPVISNDFYPTLLEMANLPLKPQQHVDGLSMMPLLKQTGTIQRDALYWHYPHYHRTTPFGAVRKGDWKLIEYYEDMRVELYNLKDDLSEEHDLAKEQPAKAEELREMLHAWRKAVGAQMPTPNPKYDPEKDRGIGHRRRRKVKVKPGAKDKEFDVLTAAAVDASDLGYAVRTAPMGYAVALKKLKEPITGPATFKLKLRSIAKLDGDNMFQNGFLAFGDGPDEAQLIKCGMYLGGQRNYTIIEGVEGRGGWRVKVPLPGDNMREFEMVVAFDPAAGTVAMKSDGKTVKMKLRRKIKSVQYVGYCLRHAVTAFSPVEIVRR